ncbi:MAG: response regulator [Gammaproteobacteria bacterium]|nr:response regulator [Gammaproteobacteria bacterium]
MNTKILVVDDEPDIRFLLKDILEDEGYEVDVAEHAAQARQRKAEFSPDLVLLDIWMPEMDGVSLLKQWNESDQLDCPVVMMSGHGTVETAVEATRYGAYDFVEKPLSTAKLLHTVKAALERADQVTDSEQLGELEQPVGNSQLMQDLRSNMQALAAHLHPVFITGVKGAGVSLWANYLFRLQSNPNSSPFVADITRYQQGLQHNIFIREVTELNRQQQQVLLALLELAADSNSSGRLVLASQHDYQALRANDGLLPELAEYWREAMTIPTLAEHIEDMPELLEYYATWFSDKEDLPYRHFGVAAQNLLRNHAWQGGLDELKSMIRQILTNSADDNVELTEIQHFLQATPQPAASTGQEVLQLAVDTNMDMREAREFFEREFLKKQLELCGYNVSVVAKKIGQERTNLYRKLKSLGLQIKK